MKKLPLFLLWLVLCGFALAASEPADKSAAKPTPTPSPKQRKYYFEHRLLPKWALGSDGAFFEDLQKGLPPGLVDAATEIVGKDFAEKIAVHPVPDAPMTVIALPKPVELTECFHVIVAKDQNGYRYITLELTEDLFGDGTKSILCEWTQKGHQNYGARTYTDEAAFITDAKKLLATNPSPNASVTVPAK